MTFILTLSLPGQPPTDQPVGLMINEQACHVAGAGMVAVLQDANPGLSASWTCLQTGEAA